MTWDEWLYLALFPFVIAWADGWYPYQRRAFDKFMKRITQEQGNGRD